MSRYKALRLTGCDPLVSGFISLINWMREVPQGEIKFMHLTIEYDKEQA